MDWQRGMNRAMAHIERHLSGHIDYAALARHLQCSPWEFQRVFSLLTQIPLSEYIRRRRLTRAAEAIVQGERILDVALRYGYASQAAFSRAFKQWHGCAPSLARRREAILRPFPAFAFKMIVWEELDMDKHSRRKTNVIGAGEVGYAVAVEMEQDTVHQINSTFWDTAGNDLLGPLSLPLYGAFVSEEQHRLLGDVAGRRVLEIGCGSGDSLQYIGERQAAELWGLDLSREQLQRARQHLQAKGLSATLVNAPMEAEAGIPKAYFDLVYSVYAIGWTTDLDATFGRVASYLKPGGLFVFSWSHPLHKCVAMEQDLLLFKKCYFDEDWYTVALGEHTLSLSDRKLSTYVNALARAGFVIEEMVEASDQALLQAEDSAFAEKAKMLPVTLVLKARKGPRLASEI